MLNGFDTSILLNSQGKVSEAPGACVMMVRDGKLVISEKDDWAMRGYQIYGEVAASMGMEWGGRWKMMDFGHVELRLPGVIKQ